MSLNQYIISMQNNLEVEHRRAVFQALAFSDGSFSSFAQELTAQIWDYPDLPVQDILDMITV